MRTITLSFAAVSLAAATAFASSAPNGAAAARYRRGNLDALLAADRAIRNQVESSSPNFAVIQKASARMRQLAAAFPSWFPPGSGPDSGANTNAKPEIWTNPDDFRRKELALYGAVLGLDAAAKARNVDRVKTARSAVSRACRACHEVYEDRF